VKARESALMSAAVCLLAGRGVWFWGLGFKGLGYGFGIWVLGFGVSGVGFGVWGLGFRV
jgi:hypothetical protein